MVDYGHKLTDKLLEQTEKEIHVIYDKAAKEAQKKADKYFDRFKQQDADMRKLLEDKQITETEYKTWRNSKMIGGSRYKSMAEGLSRDMTNANKLAASVINGHLPDVYATNFNWGTYKIEQDARVDTNFMIYDRQTVERLIRDNPELLPMKAKISVPKDKLWNKQHINGAITQGILLGESIPDISKRLAAVTDMNRSSAIRNARTMTTSAENGGRIDSYKRAEDMGIKVTQEWLATKDGRTRHEHAMLDGQERKVGEAFEVEGYKIMFPGDPEAEPFLTYNCRCTLVSNFKGFDHKKMDAYTEAEPMSYKEWEEKHQRERVHVPQPDRPPTKEGWLYQSVWTYEKQGKVCQEMNEMIETAPEQVQALWKKNAPEFKRTLSPKGENSAYFSTADERVHLNTDAVTNGDAAHIPYQTHFHEYAHNIDYMEREGRNYFFSDGWKDEKGRKFEEVIMDEWKEKFGVQKSDVQIGIELFREQRIEGGVGAEDFVIGEIADWRKRNGLSFRSEEYKAMKEEAMKCQNTHEYITFYKKHISEFLTDDIRRERGFSIDKSSIKTYIRDMRDNYSLTERGKLSDMMERFTVKELDIDYPLGVGHGKKYAKAKNTLSREAFAHMVEGSICNRDSLELVKKELPESYAAFEKMLSDILNKHG